MIKDYKDLTVWQRSMDLAVEVYKLVKLLPREETYALSDQMRRAVVSISSNIAEGQQRGSDKSFIHFLQIARGSNAELESQVILCTRLGYCSPAETEPVMSLIGDTGRMLNNFIKKLVEDSGLAVSNLSRQPPTILAVNSQQMAGRSLKAK